MGEPERGRSAGQRLVHGLCGAVLAALTGICVQLWLPVFHWWLVGLCAGVGFVLGWFVGEEAIELLKTLFRWS
jgi:hypothetical protein